MNIFIYCIMVFYVLFTMAFAAYTLIDMFGPWYKLKTKDKIFYLLSVLFSPIWFPIALGFITAAKLEDD